MATEADRTVGVGGVIWREGPGTTSWASGWGLAAISIPFRFFGGFNIGFFTSGGVIGFSGINSAGLTTISGGVSVFRLEVLLLGVAGFDSESNPPNVFLPLVLPLLLLAAEELRPLSELPFRVLRLPGVSSASDRLSLSSSPPGRTAGDPWVSSVDVWPRLLVLDFMVC